MIGHYPPQVIDAAPRFHYLSRQLWQLVDKPEVIRTDAASADGPKTGP